MSPALVLSSQIKCSAPGDKEKMNKLAALERKMQVTGDYGSDSDSDRRAEIEREGRPLAGLLLAGVGTESGIWERCSSYTAQTSPAVNCLGFLQYCTTGC